MPNPNLNKIIKSSLNKLGNTPNKKSVNLRLPRQEEGLNPYFEMYGERGETSDAPIFAGMSAGVPLTNGAGLSVNYNRMIPMNGQTGPAGFSGAYTFPNRNQINAGYNMNNQYTVGARIGFAEGGIYLSDRAKATQFGQYEKGGGLPTPYSHEFIDRYQKDYNNFYAAPRKNYIGIDDGYDAYFNSIKGKAPFNTTIQQDEGPVWEHPNQGSISRGEKFPSNYQRQINIGKAKKEDFKYHPNYISNANIGSSQAANLTQYLREQSNPGNMFFNTDKYRMGGGMFPEYHSFAPPMMAYGGDPSIADLQQAWLSQYGPGGESTDGCGPGFNKNPLTGQCAPNGWKAPQQAGPTVGAAGQMNRTSGMTAIGNYNTTRQQPAAAQQSRVAGTYVPPNSRTIMGRQSGESTSAPAFYNPNQNYNINTGSTLGKQQISTLTKAGFTPAQSRAAVGSKRFTSNQQEALDAPTQEQLVYRIKNNPNYNPAKSMESQSYLADDNSLLTRINRGSRAEAFENPVGNFAWEVMSAPGKGFNNMFLEKDHYAGQNLPMKVGNMALDIVSMVPEIGPAIGSAIKGAGKKLLGSIGSIGGRALTDVGVEAGANLIGHQASQLGKLGHHGVEMLKEGVGHKVAHSGVHSLGDHGEEHGGGHEEMGNTNFTAFQPVTKKKFKTGGWLDRHL